jgi:hypothetical protein
MASACTSRGTRPNGRASRVENPSMTLGLAILAASMYAWWVWNADRWIVWLTIGAAAVAAQLSSTLGDYLSRFRVARRMPAPLRTRWIDDSERSLRDQLARAPFVLVAFGLVAWWGSRDATPGVGAQIALALFAWIANIAGWLAGIKLWLALRR